MKTKKKEKKVKVNVLRHVIRNDKMVLAPGLREVTETQAKELIKKKEATAFKAPKMETAAAKNNSVEKR